MTCPSEEKWAVLVDGELPQAEGLALREHAAGCARCRALELALREENAILVRSLEEAVPRAENASHRLGLVLVAASLVLAAVGAHALSNWLSNLESETPAGIVNGRSLIVSVLADAFFYLLREGASMLDSLLSILGIVGIVGIVGLTGFFLLSGRKGTAAATFLLALSVASAPATALETRTAKGAHSRIVIGAGETIDDSLLAAGGTVTIDGVVTGNLIAAGDTVLVRGTVRGDLITAGKSVEIAGSVDGNVFAGGGTVIVRGHVGQSVHGVAEKLRLDSAGTIGDDLFLFAGDVAADGHVGRDLFAFCGTTDIRGEVSRNATAHTRRLQIDSPARIGGNLVAQVDHEGDVQIDPQAKVSGRKETKVKEPEKSRFVRPGFYLWKLIWLAAAFVTSLVLHRLFPTLFAGRLPDAGALVRAMGLGFVALVTVPVGACLAAATLVGLPLGLIVLLLWVISLYVAHLLVAALVGRRLLESGSAPAPGIAPVFLLGLLAVTIAVNLPYLGGVVRFFVILLGLGLGVAQVRRRAVEVAGA